jgi:hypothetical protein
MIQKAIILYGISLGIIVGCSESQSIELHGPISMKGSSPYSYLAIYDKNSKKNYKILNQENLNLEYYQNKDVVMEVKIIKEAIGPGFPAVVEIVELK